MSSESEKEKLNNLYLCTPRNNSVVLFPRNSLRDNKIFDLNNNMQFKLCNHTY